MTNQDPIRSGKMNDAEICRKNGWTVGARLVGDEGYGPTVIQITAIGEENIIAREISRNGVAVVAGESSWTLSYRDWRRESGAESNQRGGEPTCPSCGALLPATMDGATLQEQHAALMDQMRGFIHQALERESHEVLRKTPRFGK